MTGAIAFDARVDVPTSIATLTPMFRQQDFGVRDAGGGRLVLGAPDKGIHVTHSWKTFTIFSSGET